MARVLITPINDKFAPFELQGKLTSKYFDDFGLFYYIAGQSFSADIVTILEED